MTRFASILPALVLLAACGSSPAPRYYTLDGASSSAPVAPTAEPAIWVAPVTLPESVDRPQWVVRIAPNRVAILDAHRWAEPLGSAIARAIAADLAAQLGARVSTDVQHAAAGAQVKVMVDVQRFETVPGEGVTIEALWSLRRGSDSAQRGHSTVTEPAKEAGYDALAAAHARALVALSREIAEAIRAR